MEGAGWTDSWLQNWPKHCDCFQNFIAYEKQLYLVMHHKVDAVWILCTSLRIQDTQVVDKKRIRLVIQRPCQSVCISLHHMCTTPYVHVPLSVSMYFPTHMCTDAFILFHIFTSWYCVPLIKNNQGNQTATKYVLRLISNSNPGSLKTWSLWEWWSATQPIPYR